MLGAQAHLLGGAAHRFDEIKDISRTRAGDGRHGVQLRLLRHPQVLARAGHHLLNEEPVFWAHARTCVQASLALADQGRCVGHGPHHTLGVQPCRDAVRQDAGCHRQMQGVLDEGGGWLSGLFEDLRLDCPHNQPGLTQAGVGRFLGLYTMVREQLLTGRGKGLHDMDMVCGQALAAQTANERAGHVAAADECNVLHGRDESLCCGSRLQPGGCDARRGRARYLDACARAPIVLQDLGSVTARAP